MAADKQKYLTDEFKTWITGLMSRNHVPVVSIGVVNAGHIECAGYGFAQLPDVPATPDTLWRMASTSKAHGAAVMGMLIAESNKSPKHSDSDNHLVNLSWATPIREILGEDFDLGDDYMSHNVKLEDALSHRTGLSGHDLNYGRWLGDRPRDSTKTLRFLGPYHQNPLRTQFKYCNIMFGVIADVIETITQKSFDDAARDYLWDPLEMKSTLSGFYTTGSANDDVKSGRKVLARGYCWFGESKVQGSDGNRLRSASEPGYYIPEAHIDGTITGAAGNITSSISDYTKWIAALLTASKVTAAVEKTERAEQNVITTQLWSNMTAARTIVPPFGFHADVNPVIATNISPQLYALGWFGGSFMHPGHTILHHAGGIHGFGSHVFLLPEHDFGLVIVGNAGGSSAKVAEQVGRELIGLKIGITQDERRLEGESSRDKKPKEDRVELDIDPVQILDSWSGSDESMQILLQNRTGLSPEDLCGTYMHGAYGEVLVSISPPTTWLSQEHPTMDDVRVIRKGWSSNGEVKTGSKNRSEELVLRASFQGDRCFHDTLLLHYQPVADAALQNREANFWTLEMVRAHGTLATDVVPGLAQGHGSPDDSNYPFRPEGIWESAEALPCGACFKNDSPTGKISMGLILGNTESIEAAMRSDAERKRPLKDYEAKMMWFVKQ